MACQYCIQCPVEIGSALRSAYKVHIGFTEYLEGPDKMERSREGKSYTGKA